MTVNAVRLNHAVLFVADLERSIAFYQQAFDMAVVAREPRANAAFLRLPRSGNHHDLGLFGVGAQPPRPRGSARALPPGLAGRHHRGARAGAPHPGRPRRLHRRVQPRRHQERLRPRPRRQRVRGDVDAAQGAAGASSRTPHPIDRLDLPGEVAPVGRRPHRRRARPGGRVMTTETFAPPVVATYGSTDPAAPLVVAAPRPRLQRAARSSASPPHLPTGPAYAAVRAPIAEGGGYAWFANRGIGRPVAESLRDTMDWFRTWLDDVAPAGRPVLLVGFSGGAAFAGGLVLDDPARYAGAAILYGTLPFDAGLPTDPGRLANLPVLRRPGRRRPRHPARAARPDLDLPAVRVRRAHRRAAPARRPPAHRRRRSTTSASGSRTGSRSSTTTAPPRPDRARRWPGRRFPPASCPPARGPRPR